MRRALRRSLLCWSMARSHRIWCGTIRRWHAPRRKQQGCFWRMRELALAKFSSPRTRSFRPDGSCGIARLVTTLFTILAQGAAAPLPPNFHPAHETPMNDDQSLRSRLDFIGIDRATREALRELQPLIARALPAIL